MKPLILILLAATYAAAQTPTLADYARQERARRAQSTGAKVYTIKSAVPAPAETTAPDGAAPTPGTAPAAGTPTPASAVGVAAPGTQSTEAAAEIGKPDPVQVWIEETENPGSRIRQLVVEETPDQI